MRDAQGAAITDRMAEHLRRGELLDLAPELDFESPIDEVVMTSWDGTHSIAADDIRDLLRGRIVTDADPRGLRLRAARIHGRLDLDNLITTVKLTLLDCLLDGGITAKAAHLPGLSLQRCLLTHASKPALYADELRTDAGVSFQGCTIHACTVDGAMRMNGARIGGQLDCSAAVVTSTSDPQHRWDLDGLTYARLPLDPLGKSTTGWLDLFRTTLGYGYQPWRALLFLFGVIVTSVVLAVLLGAHGALAHPQDPNNPAVTVPCTVTERVDVGLEVVATFLDTHARDRCTTTNTATGIGLSYSTRGLQLLAGTLAVLFVTGFTGIVRKT